MTGYTFSQLIDFTRTSAATYVNSAGNIVSTPASVNLLTHTQEFANAAWSKTNATITANSTTAPDGTLTADTLTASAGAAVHNVGQNTTISGVACTWSIYAKAGTSSFLQLVHTANSNFFANFNLATGAVGTVGSLATATITSVGNGWYRCSMTFTPTSGSLMRVAMISSATAVFNESWTAAGTEAIYIWGAQLELGSTATTYTRNFGGLFPARFDYDPVTLAPRGLLVEEQRTNLLLRSEEFDNASWIKTRSSVTANATTSPDGTVDADKLVEDTTAAASHFVSQNIASHTSGVAYTMTVYAKAAERSQIRVNGDAAIGLSIPAIFDLSSGTVVSAGSFTASIQNAGNGWYRCVCTGTATATSAGVWVVGIAVAGNTTYTGDGTSGIFVYGAQLEAGAFATSYIPTTASQVTRAADVPVIQAPNFAPWYNQSEGTFVVEADAPVPIATSTFRSLDASDGTTSNRIGAFVYSGKWGSTATVAGVFQYDLQQSSSYTANVPAKTAFAYKANDFAVSVNGSAALTDTAGAVPAVDRLSIACNNAVNQLNGHIRSIRYYPTRLSNAQLQALSA